MSNDDHDVKRSSRRDEKVSSGVHRPKFCARKRTDGGDEEGWTELYKSKRQHRSQMWIANNCAIARFGTTLAKSSVVRERADNSP